MTDLWRGTTTLITGASRGLGQSFAESLADRGTALVLTARGADALEALAARLRAGGTTVTVLPADLTRAEGPDALAKDLERRGLTVDHLINNAGMGPAGRAHELPADIALATIDLNVRAVTALASRLLPGMVARGRGGVLNMASTAAWQGLCWLPVYSGSKAYVITWSEAAWIGLRGTGVRCCCCSPGPVETPFFEANRFGFRPPAWILQQPAAVVRRALRAYERDACHVLPHPAFRLLAWGTRLVPRALAARLGGWYGAPPGRPLSTP
jgi:short-subunit dehydrogenase